VHSMLPNRNPVAPLPRPDSCELSAYARGERGPVCPGEIGD
jgi:hypothetical protein